MPTFSNIESGYDVFGSDRKKIGVVKECTSTYCHIDTGFLGLGPDYYVPLSFVQNVQPGEVYLNVPSNQVSQMGWDTEPTGDLTTTAGRGEWTGTGTMPRSELEGEDTSGYSGEARTGFSDASNADYSGEGRTGFGGSGTSGWTGERRSDYAGERGSDYPSGQGTRSMPLREEELRARKTREQAGEVQIGKDVVEEQRTVDVPLTREEAIVRERPVDRPASEPIGEGDTIRVPLHEERVEVEKTPHVYGEVDIEKRQVTEQRQVGDTVRREVPRVNKSGNLSDRVESDLESDTDRANWTDEERRRFEQRRRDQERNR